MKTNTKNTHCLSSDPQMCLLGISKDIFLCICMIWPPWETWYKDKDQIIFFKHPELDPDGISHSNRRQEGLFYQGITALQRLSSQERLHSIMAFMEKKLSLEVYLRFSFCVVLIYWTTMSYLRVWSHCVLKFNCCCSILPLLWINFDFLCLRLDKKLE